MTNNSHSEHSAISLQDIQDIVQQTETIKEAKLISICEYDESKFKFKNNMPDSIGKHIQDTQTNISAEELDEISNTAKQLLEVC